MPVHIAEDVSPRPNIRLTHAFRNSSIQLKLSLLIILSCSLALILAGAGFLTYQAIQYRKTAAREISAVADIVAASSTAALTFSDERAERETLAALRGYPRQIQAAVYNEANRLFATYRNPGVRTDPRRRIPAGRRILRDGVLLLFHPIKLQNQRIGTIMLKFSMNDAIARLWQSAEIIFALLIVSLILALLVVARLQHTITDLLPFMRTSRAVFQPRKITPFAPRKPETMKPVS